MLPRPAFALPLRAALACAALAALAFLPACGGGAGQQARSESYSSGQAAIAVDASVQPAVAPIAAAFQQNYPDAQLSLHTAPEGEAVRLLLADSVRLAVLPRQLSAAEQAQLAAAKAGVRHTVLGLDAIALITHPANPDTALTLGQVVALLRGQARTWQALGRRTRGADSLRIVVDHPRSSIARFLADSLLRGQALPPQISSLQTTAAVVDYVAQNKNAIGLVGLAWVADESDSTTNRFLARVRVLNLAASDSARPVKPYQFNLANGSYPLRRVLYLANREPRMGPATGFANFATGDIGQRILYQRELLQAIRLTRQIRLVPGNVE